MLKTPSGVATVRIASAGTGNAMVYRRTHQVVKRLAARRSAILAAARDAAAESGMAAVPIAPRRRCCARTVFRAGRGGLHRRGPCAVPAQAFLGHSGRAG